MTLQSKILVKLKIEYKDGSIVWKKIKCDRHFNCTISIGLIQEAKSITIEQIEV